MNLAHDFASLFAGRKDAFGTEEGGVAQKRVGQDLYERIPLNHDVWTAHLNGARPIGVYPLVPDVVPEATTVWRVKWGCVDFDEGETESFIHAQNVRVAMESLGVKAWVERSRSKGYHVWVFLQGWMEARLVREALLGVCQVVDAPTKEINPKSIGFDDPATLGNYVRLPYPGAMAHTSAIWPSRRVMVTPSGSAIPLTVFLPEAERHLASLEDMKRLQALYEPPKRIVPVRPSAGRLEGDIYKRMSGLAWTIFQEGPREGMGRGHTLYKLACLLVEGGHHTPDEVYQLCWEADQAWGKFHVRPNGEAQVLRVVERAHGG